MRRRPNARREERRALRAERRAGVSVGPAFISRTDRLVGSITGVMLAGIVAIVATLAPHGPGSTVAAGVSLSPVVSQTPVVAPTTISGVKNWDWWAIPTPTPKKTRKPPTKSQGGNKQQGGSSPPIIITTTTTTPPPPPPPSPPSHSSPSPSPPCGRPDCKP